MDKEQVENVKADSINFITSTLGLSDKHLIVDQRYIITVRAEERKLQSTRD
jgi:hypothetical protein